jgi:hypothetical protein
MLNSNRSPVRSVYNLYSMSLQLISLIVDYTYAQLDPEVLRSLKILCVVKVDYQCR